ncbi:MAG: DUF4232 domain-containing protein [Acidimicrobiales bacterium]
MRRHSKWSGRGLGVVGVVAIGLVASACSSSPHRAATSHPSTAPTTSSSTAPTTSSPAAATTTAPGGGASNRCHVSQLSVGLDPTHSGGAAAGSVGYTYVLTNTSSSLCTLEAYPGLQMLNAANQPIPTHVSRGKGASTVPPEPVNLVSLAPGGKAWFALGFADQTGYGSAQCPRSTSLEVTPPNAYGHLSITGTGGQLQPFGGTAQAVQCGDITVSPVLSKPPF